MGPIFSPHAIQLEADKLPEQWITLCASAANERKKMEFLYAVLCYSDVTTVRVKTHQRRL